MATPTPAQPEATKPGQAEEDQQVKGGQAAGGVDSPGTKPGEVAPVEKKPRQRKERLPGVMSRDDGDDIFPELGFKSNSGKRVSREEAQKEADLEMRQELGLDIPEPPEKKADEPELPKEPEATKKIKFAGKEFATLEEAEQVHKSLQGMFKPLQERVERAEQLAEKAAESARSWRQRAMELEGAPPQTPTKQVQPSNEQAAEQELAQVMERIDGNRFESLAREHGLPIAGRYLAAQVLATVHDQMLPKLAEKIMAQVQEQYAPVTQSVEFQQQTQEVSNLIENVSQLKNMDGNPAFPELDDPAELEEIAELWSSSGQATATPQSLIQAIALYRLYRGARGGNQTPNTPTVNVTEPPTTVQKPQSLPAGGAGPTPSTPRAGSQSEASRFARALDDAHLVDPILGFARRRR